MPKASRCEIFYVNIKESLSNELNERDELFDQPRKKRVDTEKRSGESTEILLIRVILS